LFLSIRYRSENNGQFQVVIGNAVGSVFQEFEKLIDQNEDSNNDSQEQKARHYQIDDN
jgi:phosphotransferase system IIB component